MIDSNAFNDFYKNSFDLMYTVASRFFPESAADIVADFIKEKILKGNNIDKFLTANNQEAFLKISVANFCKTQIKINKKHTIVSLDNVSTLNLTVEPEIGQNEFSDYLKQIFSTLPVRQRKVIEMSIEGYDYSEIADDLKTTIPSVRNLIHRARGKIFDALKS